jgi:hypothetical protein
MKNKILFTSPSKFGNPVSSYSKVSGYSYIKKGYKVVFIFDGLVDNLPENTIKIYYYTWLIKRSTKTKYFVFFIQLIKEYKPNMSLSNFVSTNVMLMRSFLLKVEYRINYVFKTTKQINFWIAQNYILR